MSSKEILINSTLDKIRHFLQKDGGDVEFIKLEKNIVYVNMKGACEGCSYAYADIKELIEVILQEEVDPKLEVKLASEM
ncbi:MAG: NifU family protein [Erysipelotrichaceae bacterium]|nr:NifU family protein [Erysipelotrichaceae bacterium]